MSYIVLMYEIQKNFANTRIIFIFQKLCNVFVLLFVWRKPNTDANNLLCVDKMEIN